MALLFAFFRFRNKNKMAPSMAAMKTRTPSTMPAITPLESPPKSDAAVWIGEVEGLGDSDVDAAASRIGVVVVYIS